MTTRQMLRQTMWPQIGRISPQLSAQGIAAEIPQADRREAEELKRKARSPLRGDAPKNRNSKQDLKLNSAISRVCKYRCRTKGRNRKPLSVRYRGAAFKPAGGKKNRCRKEENGNG
jgi:hypothetical protein